MPSLIDYPLVLDRMTRAGFRCHYHNAGAFGLVDRAARSLGWIGPADTTIRPEVLPLLRPVPPPFAANLAALAARAWNHVGGDAWIMPMSHWAFELTHGSKTWLAPALADMHIDPTELEPRNNAAAIAFSPGQEQPMTQFIQRLLEGLEGSDFALTFPDRPIIAMLHHHQQIWWTSSDVDFMAVIEALPGSSG